MAVIEDLLDELYTLDNSRWYDNISSILEFLNFPVKWAFTCGWKEYLYERMGEDKSTTSKERKILKNCNEIAYFKVSNQFKRITILSILIEDNPKTKNETVYDITRVFTKIYGRYVMIVFVFRDEIAFAGTAFLENKKSEVIISDWFGYKKSLEINKSILDIDFSMLIGSNYKELFENYLWAISRKYVRYHESNMYLIYGCGEFIKTEELLYNEKLDKWETIESVDREATLMLNYRYYLDCYDYDYFLDDSGTQYQSLHELYEDNSDLEWTILEMEVEDELNEGIPEVFGDEVNNYDDELSYEFFDLNPEEMLQHIRGNRN